MAAGASTPAGPFAARAARRCRSPALVASAARRCEWGALTRVPRATFSGEGCTGGTPAPPCEVVCPGPPCEVECPAPLCDAGCNLPAPPWCGESPRAPRIGEPPMLRALRQNLLPAPPSTLISFGSPSPRTARQRSVPASPSTSVSFGSTSPRSPIEIGERGVEEAPPPIGHECHAGQCVPQTINRRE